MLTDSVISSCRNHGDLATWLGGFGGWFAALCWRRRLILWICEWGDPRRNQKLTSSRLVRWVTTNLWILTSVAMKVLSAFSSFSTVMGAMGGGRRIRKRPSWGSNKVANVVTTATKVGDHQQHCVNRKHWCRTWRIQLKAGQLPWWILRLCWRYWSEKSFNLDRFHLL